MKILLVEDSPADVRLAREAFREVAHDLQIDVATDGEMAIQMLGDYITSADKTLPRFVLLDLNLPGSHGFEVLEYSKSHAVLREIPVIVFSTSKAPSDVKRCYALNANSYVQKPRDLPGFITVMKSILEYWTKIAEPAPR